MNLDQLLTGKRLLSVTLKLVCAALLLVGFRLNAAPQKDPLLLLTSIRPLALIAQDLVSQAGISEKVTVEPLLKAGVSPHHFALKVRELAQVKRAAMVVWVGPRLEGFLVKAVSTRSALTLSELKGMHWPEEQFEGLDQKEGEHNHVHGSYDPHVWLDPENAYLIAQQIGVQLQQLMPQHTTELQQALGRYKTILDERIQTLDASFSMLLSTQAAAHPKAGIAVFHDSLSHFLQRFNIPQAAALTLVPEQQIGLRSLVEHKQQRRPSCLLADRQELEMAQGFASKLSWPLVEYDLLAQDKKVSTYLGYIDGIARAVETCLKKD